MADIEDIEAITDAAAARPQQTSVTPTSTSVQNHSLPDLIAFEKHRSEQAASRSGRSPFRQISHRPPGGDGR